MAICLSAGVLAASIAAQSFTLAWTHSVEKVRWEEDWRIAGDRLEVVAARVRGSGAGMEPPAGAVLRDGVWHYRPAIAPLRVLVLTHSPYAADYELCAGPACRPLAALLPGLPDHAAVEIVPCAGSTATAVTPGARPSR
ncbi:MAG: DUF1850 domain-containing protein [Betaproteobacteria bacterium]|nr:DUF1850 domain-containing protein [Betaproteobacteria bacterium]